MRSTIDALKRRHAALQSPYLVSLADGSMTREQFVETQIQFLFAVVFFSRPMATLAGRLPKPQMRVALLENIRDEHGDGRLTVCHENTFIDLLERLGVQRTEIDARALWPEVRAFNTLLAGLCTLDDALSGLAALGMIEDLFSDISASIGRSICKRGFLPKDQVVHYTTHQTLDVQHAEGFYAGLYEPYSQHARLRYEIDQGLELGAYAFMTMYEGLYRARDRRWVRDVRGPHSVTDGWYVDDKPARSSP